MKTPILALAVGLGALLCAAPQPAGAQTLDTTLAVRPGARFELQNVAGTVEIRGTRRQEIRIRVEYDRARIEIDGSPSAVRVRTVPRRGMGEAQYTIELPTGTALTVSSISSDIDVQGVCGEAELQSFSGEVRLACGQGNVSVQSLSGEVTVSDVRGRLEAGSTSGSVIVENVRADVAAHSASGDLTLLRVEGQDVSAETVSGEVEFSGPIREGGRYRFQSHSGDVTVRADERNLNATISVSTFSGDLESDYPVTLAQGSRFRAREFEFTIGNGSARLVLASFSGTIYLRRGAAAPGREEEQ